MSTAKLWAIGLAVILTATLGIGFYAAQRSGSTPEGVPRSTGPGNQEASQVTSPRASLSVHSGALNLLLLGSDSRDPRAPSDRANPWRADTIAVVHIPPSHDRAVIVFLPRDLWVNGQKVNAAYSRGGAAAMKKVVQGYTGVKIDYVGVVDFGGLQATVNGLGGVDMPIEKTIRSIHRPYRTFKAGTQHLNGAEALDYIRQRKQFARGDFDRIRHQQQFLVAMLKKATTGGHLTKMDRLRIYLSKTRGAVDWYPRIRSLDVAWQLRGIGPDDLEFMTSPNRGTGMIDGQSVVLSDDVAARQLYGKIRGNRYFG